MLLWRRHRHFSETSEPGMGGVVVVRGQLTENGIRKIPSGSRRDGKVLCMFREWLAFG
jgi:hypothetical protein